MGRGEYGSGGGGGAAPAVVPGWLGRLVEESFFVSCGAHESRKKNEKNILCLDCCSSICPHCAPAHSHHPLLQVRRYVYNDVVRLDDLEKLIDCSFVQPYTINSAKVVFLKPRPQSRPFKGSGNICMSCDRILQEPFHFCSLSCKVEHVLSRGEDLSSILFRLHDSDLAFSRFENLRMDGSDLIEEVESRLAPDSILEDPTQYDGSSGSSADRAAGRGPRKKKTGGGFLVLSLSSRRKGAPHRSPLS
ncbi:protein RGF1 INDUCIBLE TRANSCRIPTION FACTOR 1-like [Zingiber officinale]|uniref:protein RGF1 INDUCIBLE TRANSCRIPTION FACTOR 1-like n=1 Tax=Zingiber officinale TaxID=94328 RepID=UPI001C4ADCE7|nr:protein RGF1 INDUCIBLE TRANSCRIPTION FACTOR 1-like [Zingiber officinale]